MEKWGNLVEQILLLCEGKDYAMGITILISLTNILVYIDNF